MRRFWIHLKKEPVFLLFLFILIILSAIYPDKVVNYPSFVDWRTIVALTGLVVITNGAKESGYLRSISMGVLERLRTERHLAIFFILLSAALSTFLTNDVALLIVVPLTVELQGLIKNNITKIAIFEAIAANVGSSLTPIGNPPNLFLWHQWGISFLTFIMKLLPLFTVLMGFLLLYTHMIFKPRKVVRLHQPELKGAEEGRHVGSPSEQISKPENQHDEALMIFSCILLIIYVVSIEMGFVNYFLPLVLILYLLFYREVLLTADWLLLMLFIIIFIDIHIISTTPLISGLTKRIDLSSGGNVFIFSAIISQIMSNVPASVFVAKFTQNWFAITYGVNVGGNGIITASLANIIALRLASQVDQVGDARDMETDVKIAESAKGEGGANLWLEFHKYSLPYFLVSVAVIHWLFFGILGF